MKWLNQVAAFLNRDVANPNESKKNAVMTRWICVVMVLYMAVQAVAMLLFQKRTTLWGPLVQIAAYAVVFYLTYAGHTIIAHFSVIGLALSWSLISNYLYGWMGGSQYASLVIVVFIFTGTHLSLTQKFVELAGFLALDLCIILYALRVPGKLQLSDPAMVAQNVLGLLMAGLALVMITVSFAGDTLEAERKLMNYNKEVAHQARTDALTALMNRRAAQDYFEQARVRFLKEGVMLNLAIGDIDFFKQVNDTYGHDAGDAVLLFLAQLFTKTMEGKGIVARWGGEEFLFLLTNMNGDDAHILLEDLRLEIERSVIRTGGREIRVTMTFGLEEFGRSETFDKVLEAADRKLYMGKAGGRNRVVM